MISMREGAYRRLATVAAVFVVALGTLAGRAAAQIAAADGPVEQTRKGSDGVQDGIKLHGNWVLDVRNPDGTLVRHSEFKNSLMATGQAGLAKLLRGLPFYAWVVTFNESHVINATEILPDLCAAIGLQMGIGQINVSEPSGPHGPGDGICFVSTLSVAAPGNQLVMTGSFTVTRAGEIQRVVTHLQTQGGAVVDNRFTMATLPTPLPVAQGQIVQFTYTLSFS
jgi:hypothetical protein